MPAGLRVIAFIAFFLLAASSAAAEKRVALVIGNNNYPSLGAGEQLRKAVNDANAVGDALKQLGFDVRREENLPRAEMLSALLATADKLAAGDLVFFFFAGHGVSIDGANYLLPADIPSVDGSGENLVKFSAISEAIVIETLKSPGSRVAVVVIDACRNNPFSKNGTRAFGDSSRGLSRPPTVETEGVFGFYSAGFGQTALDRLGDDDPNPNSIFTRVLAPALLQSGDSLIDVAYAVNAEVEKLAGAVGHNQSPAYYDQARGRDIFLAGSAASAAVADAEAPPPAPAASVCAQAESHYNAALSLGTAQAFEDHVSRFGSCAFAGLAAQRIALLAEQETDSADPPAADTRPPEENPDNLAAECRDLVSGRSFDELDSERAVETCERAIELSRTTE